jgi:plastocyanin
MKILHLAIITILIVSSIASTVSAFADNGTLRLGPPPKIPVQLVNATQCCAGHIATSPFIHGISLNMIGTDQRPGSTVTITGSFLPQTQIELKLEEPNDTVVQNETTMTDKVGEFSSFDLKIPLEAAPGEWNLNATSGNMFTDMQFIVEPLSPLNQLKLGVLAKDVTCNQELQLVIKSEDGLPACVRYTIANVLIERGWARESISTMTSLEPTVIIPVNSSIAYKGFTFTPSVIKTIIGTNNTIRWINMDSVANDITGDSGSFRSGVIESGYAWTHTFYKIGTYGYHSDIHPWLRGTVIVTANPMANLANDTGIITMYNQTYYFETPNYTSDAYFHPVQISFHDVVFTLFPTGFRGGLPVIHCGLQGPGLGMYYWADSKFSDNTHELLHLFAYSPTACNLPIPSMFSNHTNPQAGLMFYDGKMKLLVSAGADSIMQTPADNSSSLKLYFSTSSQSIHLGQAVGITISVNNTLPAQLYVKAENSGVLPSLSLDPCVPRPFGITMFQGYYTEQNMTKGNQLLLFNPDVSCPVMNATLSYVFEPSSAHAVVYTCTDAGQPLCSYNDEMADHVSIGGYWYQGNLYPFKSGTYTIVGGDEWGHVAIEHFAVGNSTVASPNDKMQVQANNGTFTGFSINYTITGGENEILNVTLDEKEKSLSLGLDASNSGNLTVSFPPGLADLMEGEKRDNSVIILEDKKEIRYTESQSNGYLNLVIPFQKLVTGIEIIGTQKV